MRFLFAESHNSDDMYFCFRWVLVVFKREFFFDDIMRLWEVSTSIQFLFSCILSSQSFVLNTLYSGFMDRFTMLQFPSFNMRCDP